MESILIDAPDLRLTSRLISCGRETAPLLLCIHGGGCNGGYFAIKGFSVAHAALAYGFDVLLVDRPGHGRSAPPRTGAPIEEAADLLAGHLAAVMAVRQTDDLIVIGHSIGGAVALTLAARAQVTMRAVAVSGIGRTPSDSALAWLAEHGTSDPEPPPEFFFGPHGSYDWRGPLALRDVVEPWRSDDLKDVRVGWPARFDEIAGAIRVPVAFYLAEYERIWRAGVQDLADAAACFVTSSKVQAELLPEGGHLYELHKRGGELAHRQIAFLDEACRNRALA